MDVIVLLKRKQEQMISQLYSMGTFVNRAKDDYNSQVMRKLEDLMEITNEIRKLQDAIPMEQDQQGCWHGSFNKEVTFQTTVHRLDKTIQMDMKPRFVRAQMGPAFVYETN